jgi:hypothetical protein
MQIHLHEVKILQIHNARHEFVKKNTGIETKQISLDYRLGKFVPSLNQYFLANTTYKHGIFLYNYTLYKNAGFWLVNSRDIFYKFMPCIVNLQNFYFM